MSNFKSELKQMVAHEIGVRVDDSLEAAKRDLSLLEGRNAAFMDAAKALEALHGHVTKDVDEEVYPLATAEHVKRYVTRAINAMTNLASQASNFRLAQTGKIQALEHTIAMIKGIIDLERARSARATAPVEGAPVEEGEEGRPPLSVKEQRLIEEAESEEPVEEPTAQEDVAPSEQPELELAVEETTPRRKRRGANAG